MLKIGQWEETIDGNWEKVVAKDVKLVLQPVKVDFQNGKLWWRGHIKLDMAIRHTTMPTPHDATVSLTREMQRVEELWDRIRLSILPSTPPPVTDP